MSKNSEIVFDREAIRREYGDVVDEGGCCDYWSTPVDEVNGICPECEHPTVDGDAASGCHYSPTSCGICGHQRCDQYC
jgi:hypothetical protein